MNHIRNVNHIWCILHNLYRLRVRKLQSSKFNLIGFLLSQCLHFLGIAQSWDLRHAFINAWVRQIDLFVKFVFQGFFCFLSSLNFFYMKQVVPVRNPFCIWCWRLSTSLGWNSNNYFIATGYKRMLPFLYKIFRILHSFSIEKEYHMIFCITS